ncbi:hypothetical protein UA08_07665 [Talaromyces atroroseus]|uniref:Indole-diterpene biosynthesis protein PaxU n=1 Tax=Talaromyces atroroseus TaxID=1441469 RepID=A0A225AQI5_TALAT|nr:hypothetical protein UA08_07665 [Talaromyces atroroseus]OKL57196.1 hypothetical protein UA08_07665 [Talaromyces atroroseus]
MSTTIAQHDPLSPFIRLTPSIYLVEPRAPLPQSKDIKTIVLSFWYSAPLRALVKYVLKYADLAPSARIIFILSGPRDFYLYPTLASHRLRLKSAVDILIACQEGNKDQPEDGYENNSVYIHLFSNGGLFTTAHLLLAYKHATGKPLPVSAVVLDSSPGRPTPSLSIKALSYALPRTLIIRQIGLALLTTMIWATYVTRKSLALAQNIVWRGSDKNDHDDDVAVYGDDPFAFTRKTILDQDFIVADLPGASLKMCYIYSDSDALVPYKDVEEHAALAASKEGIKGKKRAVVHLERFSATPHVGHMRADPIDMQETRGLWMSLLLNVYDRIEDILLSVEVAYHIHGYLPI